MFGLGCVAGAVGIARAADYLRGHADHVALMARMMEGLPADSPPKLVMSILPRLRQQNDEIIALLREQNELLKRKRPAAAIHDSGGPE